MPSVTSAPGGTHLITRTARVILGLLRQSPQSIWDLKRTLHRRLSHLWSESDGQLYPAVRELIIDELITAGLEDSPRQRTPLRITEHGLRTLAESLRESPRPDTPRDELALRVSLLHERIDPTLFRHLDDELQRCLRVTDTERSRLGLPDRYTLQVVATAANWLTRRWVILLHDARAAWCREAITLLRELAHPELNPLYDSPSPDAEPSPPARVEPTDPTPFSEPTGPGAPTDPSDRADPPDPVDPPEPNRPGFRPIDIERLIELAENPPESSRPRPIDFLTLLELAGRGEPIPPWKG